jgi:hypothetical protein
MIAPPPPLDKPVAYYDTESYPNLFILKIWIEGGAVYSFILRAGERFTPQQIQTIAYLFRIFLVVSFNGNYYDVLMIGAALMGRDPEYLKWLSNQIINGMKPWDFPELAWRPEDHVDLIEVLPGAGSQKQYAGRIHCVTMRDLPYHHEDILTEPQIAEVDSYCQNDLTVLRHLWTEAKPMIDLRTSLSQRYGLDLRSKSDAQVAEAVLKKRCEEAIGYRIYKQEIDWNLCFRYEAPAFLQFVTPALQSILSDVTAALFRLGANGGVELPQALEKRTVQIGSTVYQLGIGGLHSQEKCVSHRSTAECQLIEADVAGYYPTLIINTGKYPKALGPEFTAQMRWFKDEKGKAKKILKEFKKIGDSKSPESKKANMDHEGLKVMCNGPFGKLGSVFSILFAPEMLIQTTITGQLSLLMLIERLETCLISVVSANTDGLTIKCPKEYRSVCNALIKQWEKEAGLEMETEEVIAVYSRDVNNYIAIKSQGEPKRKGEYAKSGLIEKKNPDVEICGEAVAAFLKDGIPIVYTVAACKDIRKFVTVRAVTGGGVKLWGEGPQDISAKDMEPILRANGWEKIKARWFKEGELLADYSLYPFDKGILTAQAYRTCFIPQRPEYMGKVIRWYYGKDSPGPIVYNKSGNNVPLTYGAKPCMVLPAELPPDINHAWYLKNCEDILRDIGYYHTEGSLTTCPIT